MIKPANPRRSLRRAHNGAGRPRSFPHAVIAMFRSLLRLATRHYAAWSE